MWTSVWSLSYWHFHARSEFSRWSWCAILDLKERISTLVATRDRRYEGYQCGVENTSLGSCGSCMQRSSLWSEGAYNHGSHHRCLDRTKCSLYDVLKSSTLTTKLEFRDSEYWQIAIFTFPCEETGRSCCDEYVVQPESFRANFPAVQNLLGRDWDSFNH